MIVNCSPAAAELGVTPTRTCTVALDAGWVVAGWVVAGCVVAGCVGAGVGVGAGAEIASTVRSPSQLEPMSPFTSSGRVPTGMLIAIVPLALKAPLASAVAWAIVLPPKSMLTYSPA